MAKRKRAAKPRRHATHLQRAREVVQQLQAHFEEVHGAPEIDDCPHAELRWSPYGLEIYINDFRVWSTAVQGRDGCVDELDAAYCLVCFRQYAKRLTRFGKQAKRARSKTQTSHPYLRREMVQAKWNETRAGRCEVDRTP